MSCRLHLRTFVVGVFDTNCYIAADATSLDALIIDPGDDFQAVTQAISSDSLVVRGIVNTHGHADHIAGNRALKEQFDCPIMIHELDASCFTDPDSNLSAWIGHTGPLSPPADRFLRDGDVIAVGYLTFQVIHTPGHTPGGICLLAACPDNFGKDILFSGDTLFAGGVGRTDFPAGSHEQLIESIHSKLLVLADDMVVYPGHGPRTTIGKERRANPWL